MRINELKKILSRALKADGDLLVFVEGKNIRGIVQARSGSGVPYLQILTERFGNEEEPEANDEQSKAGLGDAGGPVPEVE